jgi:amino acid adenylation domain-containing protein
MKLLHESIAYHADRQPDRLAFKGLGGERTYADLHKETDQVAQTLRALGLNKGDRVGVFLNRCLSSPIAVYGILKAGGVFVPMDPSAPPSRNAFVARDVGMRFMMTDDQQRFVLRKFEFSSTPIEAVIGLTQQPAEVHSVPWSDVRDNAFCNTWEEVTEDDLAYIMYTSGSTGQPKGIMHTHRSGMSYARLSSQLYNVKPDDVIANHSPLHFDISTFGYLSSMLAGATTILCSDAHIKMPTSLAQLIQDEGVTIWYSVPLALIQMKDTGVLPELDWSKLRWIKFGGEPFPPSYIRDIMPHTPNATWANIYGPAEVNQCSYFHFTAPPEEDQPIPLGHIWDETQALILDDEDEVIVDDTPGALVISSSTRMKGYWKNEDLTEKSLFEKDGKTYYRTGDLVSFETDGLYHFHGRKDRQVKIRGYHVELEEVELALEQHASVRNASAFPREDEDGTRFIAAAIEPAGDDIALEEVRRHIKFKLPAYAQPRIILIINALPRTSAGKVDYKALQSLPLDE